MYACVVEAVKDHEWHRFNAQSFIFHIVHSEVLPMGVYLEKIVVCILAGLTKLASLNAKPLLMYIDFHKIDKALITYLLFVTYLS